MKKILFFLLIISQRETFAQGHPPWEQPLKISRSTDGISFFNTTIFQDSSGVPSAIQWKGDTIICVFQWFRQPINSASWDKVAVKFSYDGGLSWTSPQPISISGFPSNNQRPFDPTITKINSDSLRIYYSSSIGMPMPGSDSIINTYSALSTDGVNYTFEPGARFDHPTLKAIDPAVVYFNNDWHYSAPAGAPQDGAFHATGNDGINFVTQSNYTSNVQHNWTGNFLIDDSTHLRFYGSGSLLWFNTSTDGFTWQGYTNTNVQGGDPTVVKTNSADYFMIFVGQPYTTGLEENSNDKLIHVYPNPFQDYIALDLNLPDEISYVIYSFEGKKIINGHVFRNEFIQLRNLANGIYFLQLTFGDTRQVIKIVK